MNIALALGPNSERVHLVTYGPDMGQLLVADFYYGYHYGCTAPLNEHATRKNFAKRIRRGNLICNSVFVGKVLVAVYGLALRIDDRGPFVEIEFFLGDLGKHFRPVLRAMVMRTYEVARTLAMHRLEYVDHVRMRARGRSGWKRALASVGCRIDDDGWCRDFDPLERWMR
jgi:hypothetical protein